MPLEASSLIGSIARMRELARATFGDDATAGARPQAGPTAGKSRTRVPTAPYGGSEG